MGEKILVVEDEEKLRSLYQMKLEEAGYDVFTAGAGQRALEILKNEPVDLVVLELELPDGSGFEYLQHFLNTKRNLKVIINTAYPNYKMDFHSWTADAFLIKSTDLAELKNTIEVVLHSKVSS
ncbi:MAG: response regulator [bacterium]